MRHALRQLTRSPRFAALAISCLAVGIGLNTAMFTVLNAVALRPLDGAHAERLVRLSRATGFTFTYPEYREYRSRARLLDALAASLPMESDIDVNGSGEFVTAEVVTDSYAEVFGLRPVLGRWFTDEIELSAVSVMPSGSGGSMATRTCSAGRSDPSPSFTRSSPLPRPNSSASLRRCAPISGCRSGRGRRWPHEWTTPISGRCS